MTPGWDRGAAAGAALTRAAAPLSRNERVLRERLEANHRLCRSNRDHPDRQSTI